MSFKTPILTTSPEISAAAGVASAEIAAAKAIAILISVPFAEETKSYHSVCGAEAPDSSSDDCVGWKRLSLRGAGRATRQSRRDCFASLTMTAPKDVANY